MRRKRKPLTAVAGDHRRLAGSPDRQLHVTDPLDFEVDAGGHTTLEKHEHTHLVIPIKGKGSCLVDDEVLPLAIHDLVYVPAWAWHQFRAAENEVLGFLCMVKVKRDRPTLPTPEELAQMKSNPEVAAFLRNQNFY